MNGRRIISLFDHERLKYRLMVKSNLRDKARQNQGEGGTNY